MLSVRHSYVLLCGPYVIRVYSHFTHMSLVRGFTMNLWVRLSWRYSMHFFVPHIFYHNKFLRLT